MIPIFWLLACAPPDTGALFTTLQVSVEDAAGTTHRYAEVADQAQDTLRVALPTGEDQELSHAILQAWDRGVDVEVATDFDRAGEAAIADLIAAGVPVRLADAGVTYFDFSINDDVSWPSEDVVMSHAFAVADGRRMVASSSAGGLAQGARVVFDLTGEDVIEDVLTEHVQIMGGADATAMTAFSAPAKSIADARWAYPTDSDLLLEMWLGPQERLNKRVIDAVYRAQASVWILTEDLANEGLTKALQDKAQRGFDVRVVVGRDFGEVSPTQSALFTTQTPDVDKGKVDAARVPTMLLIDLEPTPAGVRRTAQAMVMTHPLWSSARLFQGGEVRNDQLIDGAMWVLDDYDRELTAELITLRELFLEHQDRAGGL